MGRLGEQIAAFFLQRRGITIVDRNVRVGRGELDLLVLDSGRRVVVEVKTINARQPVQNAEDAFTEEKAATVARLAARLRPPARRIDLIAVSLSEAGAGIRWLRDVA